MAQLLVRDVDEALVKALRERAARHGRSAEAEHREILAKALRRTRRKSFADILAAMPNVGMDEDFARIEDPAEARRVSR
ncbi:MAG: DNA-binding protein [Zoogloeaceae bacterium]|nr:DNA-binding protein [Zoogloeaceae bacterium]MCK6383909.1 DNA-binding protein [Rhodocyclaceae bacterium]